jgi:hypothetical protein
LSSFTSTGTAPEPWAPSRITGTSSSASSAGASSPDTQPTCELTTTVVVAVTAFASSSNGTRRTVAPSSRAAFSGPITPGCSWSEETISSPGPRPIPAMTLAIPSLVEVVSATSSTAHPITRA